MLTPPMMTAAMTLSSMPMPKDGLPEPRLAAWRSPARALNMPVIA